MNRFDLQTARYWLTTAGWQAQAGLALLVFAGGFGLLANLPVHAKAAQLRQQLSKAEAVHVPDRAGARAAGDQYDEFYRRLPPRRSLPDMLGKIYRAADGNSVELAHGDYKFTPATLAHLAGLQVSLPVNGSYAQVKKFVVRVLNEIPTASLDELSFKRESTTATTLEARIRLTLYVGTGP